MDGRLVRGASCPEASAISCATRSPEDRVLSVFAMSRMVRDTLSLSYADVSVTLRLIPVLLVELTRCGT